MSDLRDYFNYFTGIEEHFQKARGTSLFLLSPLDWALIETWKASGVPLDAVLRGIDLAFEKWRNRRHKGQLVNSLAFCAQEVIAEAQRAPAPENGGQSPAEPFDRSEIRAFLQSNVRDLQNTAGFEPLASELSQLLEEVAASDLESLEQKLTVLERKMVALAQLRQTSAAAVENRREMASQLAPYRGKMSAPQLAMLESQFLERKLLEQERLPRLSLFYLK